MEPRYQVSRGGLELIKSFEGYRRVSAQLADGGWTIGYGHTKSARQGAEVSKADAEALLIYDLIPVQAEVNRLVYTPLTQNQYDALVSFAFNVGLTAFRGSAVLRRINEGALLQAAFALEMWRKSDFEGERIVIDALIRRRSAEKLLFLTPPDGFVPVPSPILPPKVDYDAALAEPRQLPLNLVVAMEGDTAEAHREPHHFEPQTPVSAAAAAAEAVTARLAALYPDDTQSPGEAHSPEAPAKATTVSPDAVVDQSPGEALSPEAPATPATVSPDAVAEQPAREAVDPVSAPASELAAEPEADVMPMSIGPMILADPEPAYEPPLPSPSSIEVTDVRIGPMGVGRPKKKRGLKLMPYGPLLILGVLFFVGGVVWQVVQKDPIGLGLALLGALAISVSIFYLLRQIDDDQPLA